MAKPGDHSDQVSEVLCRAAHGDREAWGTVVDEARGRLRRMVALRLDPRLQSRVDPSDVIQDVLLEAHERLGEYCRQPSMPFFLWLRLLTGQKIAWLHRHHLGTRSRDAGLEVSLHRGSVPGASSAALAAHLLGRECTPDEAAARAELRLRLEEALNRLDQLDREVLALRHFEQLSNGETARELGIRESAASKRYLRALVRLKDILAGMPGGLEGLEP